MASLIKCLIDIGVTAEDEAALKKRTQELVTLGEDPATAGLMATQELQTEAQGEVDAVLAQLPAEEAVAPDAVAPAEKPVVVAQEKPTSKEARGYWDAPNSLIRLTESADLSTFLHEFAHFMFSMEWNTDGATMESILKWNRRNAESIAAEATRYDGTVTLEEVIQYIETKESGGGLEKDIAIHRTMHEQFARGFEKYLMEGKSPSIELRNAFRTFARWLTEIYQVIRGQMRVNLDEEVRQVFDRLLATEEQITAAQVRVKIEPLFTDKTMAGKDYMTDAEFKDYLRRANKPMEKATETLRDKLIKELTRTKEQWWKDERQDLYDEQLARLKTERVYSTQDQLRQPDGIKLDHAAVKEMVGELKTDRLGRASVRLPPSLNNTTAKGKQGVHPDEAAEFFGYNSGSEMLNDLINAPKIKDVAMQNAEAEMKRIHGDIMTDGSIAREADEAVQNEERGKLLLHELKILARGTNQRVIGRRTIKALAEDNIAKKSFRDTHPGKYRSAEIKAAQEVGVALKAGDKEAAAAAKSRQVLNYYLGMAATQAKNETEKIVTRTTRYNKKKVREEIQKAGNEYWEQIVKILGRFEFRKSATLKSVEGAEGVNQWAEKRIAEDGDGLVISSAVANESYVTHWKNVPFNELKGIDATVRNIEYVARHANEIHYQGEKARFQNVRDGWVNHMDAISPDVYKTERMTTLKPSTFLRSAVASLTKIPWLSSWLDGGERIGMAHELLNAPLDDSYKAQVDLMKSAYQPVVDAIQNRSKADQERHARKIFIPQIQVTTGPRSGRHDGNLTGAQIISVALNTGNQGNLRKMLLGEGWANAENESDININNPQLQAVLAHLTESDVALVQLIWNQMETLRQPLFEAHRRSTGLTPPAVEATSVTFTVGGRQIETQGGYYPLVYDPYRVKGPGAAKITKQVDSDLLFDNPMSISAQMNSSATQERTGFYGPINLNLDVVSNHFAQTIHYITHHEAVRQINKLITDDAVKETIIAKMGREEYNQLPAWLRDVAHEGRPSVAKTEYDRIVTYVRTGMTLGIMGFKASTGIAQIAGAFNSIAELNIHAPLILQNMFLDRESVSGAVYHDDIFSLDITLSDQLLQASKGYCGSWFNSQTIRFGKGEHGVKCFGITDAFHNTPMFLDKRP